MTRPRPGIDRVSSAWLIRRFIDPKARFVYGTESAAIRRHTFDSLAARLVTVENCTFETLMKQFAIRDGKVKRIAQIIHDADSATTSSVELRTGLDKVLNGWRSRAADEDSCSAG